MPSQEDLNFDPATFSGVARLFPLPNLVLFPHVMQPLHIFEPRYRAMVEEAITSDQLIALASLAPGWEGDYEGRPPLLPTACLGRIASYQRVKGDCFNLLLLGLKRVEIERELPPSKLFREARVAVREDVYRQAHAAQRHQLQKALIAAFKLIAPSQGEVQEQLDELLGSDIPLGVLTDIVGYTLDLGLTLKEQLLAECDVDRRAMLLLEHLHGGGSTGITRGARFPPDFSTN